MTEQGDVEPPYQLILDGLEKGKVIPFLGAGASLPALLDDTLWKVDTAQRFPLALELAEALAGYTNYPQDAPRELALVAQYFSGLNGREPLTEYLHRIFVREHLSTSLHSFLADHMRTGIIITTNYDNLVERAFGDRPFDLVVHAIDEDKVLLLRHGANNPEYVTPAKLDADGMQHPLVYKMHGTADVRDPLPDQFLITEDDYVDFLTRMMRQKVLPAPVLTALMRSNVLFLGYGLGDWNVRVILNTVARQFNNEMRKKQKLKSWAIQHQVNAVEAINWQERGVHLFVMALDRFVDQMLQVEASVRPAEQNQ